MTNPTKQWQDEADREYPVNKISDNLHETKESMTNEIYRIPAFLKGCEFEHERDKWISVEHLPDKQAEYFVYGVNYPQACRAYFIPTEKSFYMGAQKLEHVTHWQPITLPTAPKSKI